MKGKQVYGRGTRRVPAPAPVVPRVIPEPAPIVPRVSRAPRMAPSFAPQVIDVDAVAGEPVALTSTSVVASAASAGQRLTLLPPGSGLTDPVPMTVSMTVDNGYALQVAANGMECRLNGDGVLLLTPSADGTMWAIAQAGAAQVGAQ